MQFNLADFVKRAYGTNYVETLRVQIHANCRLRRIYFSDRLYSEAELPPEFKVGEAPAGRRRRAAPLYQRVGREQGNPGRTNAMPAGHGRAPACDERSVARDADAPTRMLSPATLQLFLPIQKAQQQQQQQALER